MTFFSKKCIDVEMQLVNDKKFDQQGDNNIIKLSGLRVDAHVKKIGQFGDGWSAQIKIYGMLEQDMNALSVLSFQPNATQENKIRVMAGDAAGMSHIFSGHIVDGWPDYSAAPDVPFVIEAVSDYYNRIKPAEPTSYPLGFDVAVAMQALAEKMGYSFKNNGVQIKMPSAYFADTLLRQAESIARQANVSMIIEDGVMTISPTDKPLQAAASDSIPVLSPENGLVGYPSFSKKGINFRTLFNPAIQYQHNIKLQGTPQLMLGEWMVIGLEYHLQSEQANGAWFCTVHALDPKAKLGAVDPTGKKQAANTVLGDEGDDNTE